MRSYLGFPAGCFAALLLMPGMAFAEEARSKVSGTLTLAIESTGSVQETDPLQRCGVEWNRLLAAHESGRRAGQGGSRPGAMTRLMYRCFMRRCMRASRAGPEAGICRIAADAPREGCRPENPAQPPG